jgi:hypothetical protein
MHNLAHFVLYLGGFKYAELDKVKYYINDPETPESRTNSPIIFFHGIGAGTLI